MAFLEGAFKQRGREGVRTYFQHSFTDRLSEVGDELR
jgi:hypothetical protein